MVALVRSILFWIAFFVMSSISSIGGVIALPISHKGTIFFVRIWAQAHRLFARFLLGQTIVVEGEMPDIPVLYVFKHESAFETVEQPMLFKHPAVFAKEELFSIPVWGQAARFYGLIPVDRDGNHRNIEQAVHAGETGAQRRCFAVRDTGPLGEQHQRTSRGERSLGGRQHRPHRLSATVAVDGDQAVKLRRLAPDRDRE